VGISNVISLLSGIALFLFGMALMGDGLKQVAGNKLELILYRLTGNPIKGFLLGAGDSVFFGYLSHDRWLCQLRHDEGTAGNLHCAGRDPGHVHHRVDHLPF